VSHPACAGPVSFATLIEYWFGELADDEERRVDEHLLDCAHCSERLGELAGLGAGISSAFRRGAVRAVISATFLEKMKREGLRLREYRVPPGGSVDCTISAADDAVVGRLQASLAGVIRLDLSLLTERGEVRSRLLDIPFDPAAGEVLFCPSAANLKKQPAHTDIVGLIAVDGTGEHALADYTFVHTPG
jgi:hypothetical protein